MITGANRNDYHLRNMTPGKDFVAEYVDLRQVAPGDTSVVDGAPLTIHKTVEIGHVFKLGYKYSESMGLRVTNEAGEEVTPIMGSYGIGLERILSAAVELYHDKDGIALPPAIAPFTVVVTPVSYADEAQRQAAHDVYDACRAAGLDTLLDDRIERPGVKFKDADLIGIPYRVVVGKKLAQGLIEVVERRGRHASDVPASGVASYLRTKYQEAVARS
jgi:prolyl-tRNA synthetase